MKKLLFTCFTLAVFTLLFSCKPSTQEAISYNNEIIKQQEAIIKKITALADSYTNYVAKDMDAAFESATKQVSESTEEVKKMKEFDGDTKFRDEALKLFEVYKQVLEKNHSEMIRLYKLPEVSYTQKEMDQWDKLNKDGVKKMTEAFEKFKKVQIEFAQKYNFTLIEPKKK